VYRWAAPVLPRGDLRIIATGSGPRFSLESRDGTLREEDLDLEQLRARHDDLYRLYRSSLAHALGIDARFDHEIHRRTFDERDTFEETEELVT
jgi:hypothetical protein